MTRDQVIALMLRLEGGYVNNPKDPGGATKYGILQSSLDRLRARFPDLPTSVIDLTPTQATEIYQAVQWYEIHGDSLPGPLACLMMNAAVNIGEPTAVGLLQQSLGLKVNHLMDAVTLNAVTHWNSRYMPEQTLAEEFTAHCAVRYAKLDTEYDTFELGWFRRLLRVYTLAVSG